MLLNNEFVTLPWKLQKSPKQQTTEHLKHWPLELGHPSTAFGSPSFPKLQANSHSPLPFQTPPFWLNHGSFYFYISESSFLFHQRIFILPASALLLILIFFHPMTRQYSDRAPSPLIQPKIVSINFPKYQARPCPFHSSKKTPKGRGIQHVTLPLFHSPHVLFFKPILEVPDFRSADQQQFSNLGPFDQIHVES